MTKPLPLRELETLSAYLDGQLSPRESSRLESRLKNEPNLQRVLEDLRRTRQVLRSAPQVRAPRNFTLTPDMAGKRTTIPRGFKAMRFVAVAASVMLAVVFAGEVFLGNRVTSGAMFAPAAEPVAESYSLQNGDAFGGGPAGGGPAGGGPIEDAEAPMALEVGEPETVEERMGETEDVAMEEAPHEGESLDTAASKGDIEETEGEETVGEDDVGEGMKAVEKTGTPTMMGTPAPTEEMETPAETAQWAPDTTQPQEIETTGETAPGDNAIPPFEEQIGTTEDEDIAAEIPEEPGEVKDQVPLIRIVEGGLILVALISGGLAIYLRRRAG